MKTVKLGVITFNKPFRIANTYRVEILEEFGDQYQIKYLNQLNGPTDYSYSLDRLVSKNQVEGVHEKQVGRIRYFFGMY